MEGTGRLLLQAEATKLIDAAALWVVFYLFIHFDMVHERLQDYLNFRIAFSPILSLHCLPLNTSSKY